VARSPCKPGRCGPAQLAEERKRRAATEQRMDALEQAWTDERIRAESIEGFRRDKLVRSSPQNSCVLTPDTHVRAPWGAADHPRFVWDVDTSVLVGARSSACLSVGRPQAGIEIELSDWRAQSLTLRQVSVSVEQLTEQQEEQASEARPRCLCGSQHMGCTPSSCTHRCLCVRVCVRARARGWVGLCVCVRACVCHAVISSPRTPQH
jgi:hypothetical protein